MFIVDVLLYILFSVILNWMISLSIILQVTDNKKVRIRSVAMSVLSGVALAFIVQCL